MATPIFSGRARVNSGGTNLYLQEFSVEAQGDFANITSFEDYDAADDATYEMRLGGMRKLGFTTNGFYDADVGRDPGSVGFAESKEGTNLRFFIDRVANRFWDLPRFTIDKIQTGAKIPGTNFVTFSLQGQSQGKYTRPAAN